MAKAELRNIRTSLALTKTERRQLKQIARAKGTTQSEWIRGQIQKSAKRL